MIYQGYSLCSGCPFSIFKISVFIDMKSISIVASAEIQEAACFISKVI